MLDDHDGQIIRILAGIIVFIIAVFIAAGLFYIYQRRKLKQLKEGED